MAKNAQVAVINDEINRELADPAVVRALLATTFKGLNNVTMKQAMLEGMVRGFKFRDFLEKNVYAIPYANNYSLVTSIDYARKRGMRAGIIGKGAPIFVMDGKKIISCAVTVKRAVGKHIGEYTAEVYFDEYTTGRNLWSTKPRTMIAKVAEMHALRMACPEELSQMYSEEEFEKDGPVQHERMEPYQVARVIPAEEDEGQGKRTPKELPPVVEEVAQVVSEEPKREVAPLTPKQAKEMRMEICTLLTKKTGFKTLGATKDAISDKTFDLFGCTFEEDNYRYILEELTNMEK